jgi:chromosome partitioning protein
VLICDSPPAPQTDGADAYEGINGMGIPVFKRLIRSFKAYEHAANAGIPVYEVKRVGKVAWRDWEVLREEIEL